MRSKILCLLVVALGCSTVTSVAAEKQGSPAATAAELEERRQPGLEQLAESAKTSWRRIGLLKRGVKSCPQVDGWESRSLLELALLEAGEIEQVRSSYISKETVRPQQVVDVGPADLAKLHDLALNRLCVYTAEDPLKSAFPLPPGLMKEAPDRLALSTTSAGGLPTDSLSRTIWPALAEHFREQTLQGGVISGESQVPLALPGHPRVRLTFVDSEPDGEGFPLMPAPGSPHGFTLAYLAREVICPRPDRCVAQVATRRALTVRESSPLPPPEVASDQSGHVGLVSNLAMAIIAEVLHWRQTDPDKKLILNLSLGWDGELFGDLEKKKVSQLDPTVQSVYNALRFARRSGALVIAAAGNQRGGAVRSNWPLLPAAWELKRPTWLPFPLGRKPVYAVGGVDWQGMPLPNSRRGGWPRRVAYADHAVAATGTAAGPTAIYTGTSVSAAVASSIAATIWHLRPELSATEVMRLMTRSGKRLPSQADCYAWKHIWPLSKIVKAPPAKALSLCRAVARACRPDGSGCPALASLPACPEWAPEPPPGVREALQGFPGAPGSVSELPQGSHLEESVDVASQRWVIPQPEATPCPSCTLVPEPSGSYTLMMAIGEQWNPENDVTLDGATLYIDGSPSYAIVSDPLAPGSVHRISGLATARRLAGRRIQIRFLASRGAEKMSILNPVLVVP